jgi:hypothetical protein
LSARLASAVAVAVLALCGCGGGDGGGSGSATLWVTSERGERVLVTATVAAGQTAMQALDRETELETRYGGRFVQSIDGLAGSLARGVDWFWFVNGYEADRSAAEYRLRSGDVVWFDRRSWRKRMREPVVVGAFPEPFLHGFAGRRRETVVRYAEPELEAGARAIGRLVGARSVAPTTVAAPPEAHVFAVVGAGPLRLRPDPERVPSAPGDPVTFVFSGDAERLARDPGLVRYRYAVP